MYMLPKIAVGFFDERKKLLTKLSLVESMVMSYEGTTAKLDDLRSWLSSGINIMTSSPKYSIIIWDAEEMSPECQAVLLKPMEELGDQMNLVLAVENENLLLPTILSRGVVIYLNQDSSPVDESWDEIRKCWSSGPSACIAFVDKLEKERAIPVMEEVIRKLQASFLNEITPKRLLILDLAISSLAELKQTNINKKLIMDNFLISSWRIIKSAH
ncbi:MAG: hypothetical protein UX47_C0003G0057 [Candidatus Collierbacteria bacterium GW2011_GWA2_46_26]|uniref:Polymerase III, delta prime subunit protein n=1 Tax=Candidatus Collierbacteria bacterium GW2011_GWA2_46_26 TaxID=1618381 RepID=A0A0G1PL45_9BACT|nr:MAG: hypothetical protein UW29_C0002G0057 [Candidatus Collierbacteria bacterium GW2011_GWC2_44_13]KKU33534.1 MAG: hypothetical protein UX47_C0003G0057 [Candidatus Collierbacteria bacterium GW2011_GWA2_46_26]